MGKKSTKAEVEFRVNRVARMLCAGAVHSEIVYFAEQEWGIKRIQTCTYIKRAREILKQDWDIDRQQMVAELLSQVASIQKEARKQNNLNVALGCINTAARLSQVVT